MSVALIGGSGLVGGALARHLRSARRDVVVIDRGLPRVAVPFAHVDLCADNAAGHLQRLFGVHGVDTVVHLAARVDPPRDAREREQMRRLHEEGTHAVVDAARAHGVRRVVLVSSAVVYGARADNPVPLPTTSPLRPDCGSVPFAYAIDKARQEQIVRNGLADDVVSVVRPAIIYGRDAHNYLTEIIRRARLPVIGRGVLPALDGHRPPLQFVHVDDVATIVAAATLGPAGTFHAAAVDWLPYDEVARLAGLRVVDVPARIVGPILDALVPVLPSSWRAPQALFPWLMHPFVVDMEDTIARLGITPHWRSSEALKDMLAG